MEEIHFHRNEISKKCRDFHGVIDIHHIHYYVTLFCMHIEEELRRSLFHQQLYCRRYNRVYMEGDEGDYEIWLNEKLNHFSKNALPSSAL